MKELYLNVRFFLRNTHYVSRLVTVWSIFLFLACVTISVVEFSSGSVETGFLYLALGFMFLGSYLDRIVIEMLTEANDLLSRIVNLED